MDIAQLIDQAVEHHRAGRVVEAAGLYSQILAGQPNQIDALHLMGVLACEEGDGARAAQLVGQAIAIDPSQ